MLEFGMKMPISCENFLALAEEHLSLKDLNIIKRTQIVPLKDIDDVEDALPTLREWKKFEATLRNEIAKTRAVKKSKDQSEYIRGENYRDPFLAHFAQWVSSEDSPLEAERAIDKKRWEKIEDLSKGHYFDIDYLVAYALKLQILARWERISSSNGMEVLQGLLNQTV